jgi:hypothetical protein
MDACRQTRPPLEARGPGHESACLLPVDDAAKEAAK